jgi:toxin ParE1/3/4
MKPVEFHPAAQQEAEDAADYYDRQSPGLGAEFRRDLEEAVGRLGGNPGMYAAEIDEFRGCPLSKFAYTLFYLDLGDRVWVAAVAHQKRRPGYWARRKPI